MAPAPHDHRAIPEAPGSSATSAHPARLGLRALWVGVLAGPLLWSLHELVGYIAAANVCNAGLGSARLAGVPAPDAAVLIASLVLLPIAAYVLVRTARWWRANPHPLANTDSPADERAAFMLYFGAAIGGLSLIGLVFATFAGFFLRCAWS